MRIIQAALNAATQPNKKLLSKANIKSVYQYSLIHSQNSNRHNHQNTSKKLIAVFNNTAKSAKFDQIF